MDNEIIEKIYKLGGWGYGLGAVVQCVLGVLTLCLINVTVTGVLVGLLWIFGAI